MMAKRKSKRGDYEIEDLGDVELSAKLNKKVKRLTIRADADINSTRVNFRWEQEPLNLIKDVAAAMGIPYQTYIKQVLYKQALDDFAKIQTNRSFATTGKTPEPPTRKR